MFHQQDEMVSSYLFSFREASCPLFWISEFCLHSYLTPLKCQQNLVQPETDIRLEDWKPTTSNQLLSDHVSSLAANSRYVWVGTDRGVSRYDKSERRWNNFTIKNGLANNDVSAIALDGEESGSGQVGALVDTTLGQMNGHITWPMMD